MGAKENIEIVRRGYEAFQKGDLAAFDDLLADDCVWHVPGRGQLAGDKRGRKATVEYYGQLGVISEGTVKVELQELLANDDTVVGLHSVSAARRQVRRDHSGARLSHPRWPHHRGTGAFVQPLRFGRGLLVVRPT